MSPLAALSTIALTGPATVWALTVVCSNPALFSFPQPVAPGDLRIAEHPSTTSNLRNNGRQINDEHLTRLSPPQHEHVLMLGTFPFTLPHELAAGQRRALRTGDDLPA